MISYENYSLSDVIYIYIYIYIYINATFSSIIPRAKHVHNTFK